MPNFFNRTEFAVLKKAARISMPYSKVWKKEGGADTVRKVENFFAGAPRHIQNGYKSIINAFNLRSIAYAGRRFVALSDKRAEQFMWHLHKGILADRTLLRALITPLKVAFFDDRDVYESLGIEYGTEPVNEPLPRYMEQVFEVEDFFGEDLECEVVVIGSGAGGAAAAFELASGGAAVVIVEEGRYFTRHDFNKRSWDMQRKMYRDYGATLAVGNTVIPVPVGKTVGGTTTINSGTCYRTPERIIERWQKELGLTSITPETMEPYFAKVESILKVEEAKWEYLGGSARVIKRGADLLGFTKHGPLRRNAPDCDGQGTCVFGCPTGAKRSADVSFIPLALMRGAVLISKARALRINMQAGKAVGVVVQDVNSGKILNIRAEKVLVAAGTLHTPLLLSRSGISNKNIGKHVSIHPAIGMGALFDERLDSHDAIPQGYGVEDLMEEGILFEGATPQLDFAAVPFTMFGNELVSRLERYRNMAFFGFMIEDTTRGRVINTPGFSYRPTLIYNLNRHDLALIKKGIEKLTEMFFAAGAKEVYPPVHRLEILTPNDMVKLKKIDTIAANRIDITAYHPLGSCRMAANANLGVVDSDGGVFGVENLFIADGSIVPAGLGVNPQITIMSLALKIGRYILTRIG